MRVWIDVLTPKQANLFSVLARRLEQRGHEFLITSRHYREVEGLLRVRGIDAAFIGRHGGPNLSAKLAESSRRITELAEYAAEKGPDLAVSLCSPEAARVAYGLGIPHFALCDSPHAEAVCRLSLPLSKRLFTPRAVPKSAWKRFGIGSSDIVQYNALDPAVWIRAYAPGAHPTDTLGLDQVKPIVVLRTEEEYASYLLQTGAVTQSIVARLVHPLSELGAQIVVLPRYEQQVETLTRELTGYATVPAKVVDAVGLLSRASVFIGAGGTMTAEAALMGVPTISCYPADPTYVDRYLLRLGLAERVLSHDRIVSRVRRFLTDPRLRKRQKERANHALSKMEDPINVIMARLGLSRS